MRHSQNHSAQSLPVSPEAARSLEGAEFSISAPIQELLQACHLAAVRQCHAEVDAAVARMVTLTTDDSFDRFAICLCASAFYLERGDLERAERFTLHGLRLRSRYHSADVETLHLVGLVSNLALIYSDRGSFEQAIDLIRRAKTSLSGSAPRQRGVSAALDCNLALVCHNAGDTKTAGEIALQALPELLPYAPSLNVDLHAQTLAIACEALGKEERFSECLALWQQHLHLRDDWHCAASFFWFGMHAALAAFFSEDLEQSKAIASRIAEAAPNHEEGSLYPHAVCHLLRALFSWKVGSVKPAQLHLAQAAGEMAHLGPEFQTRLIDSATSLVEHAGVPADRKHSWGQFLKQLRSTCNEAFRR
ncbi:MAG: hypothetical protein QY326_08480 [Bdellovibrionota bacterium]|nr:MAG: hypothetical protein QY326_08480 [Bdellovibrionota bacterium]